MNSTEGKATVVADVHAKGILSNLFSAFMDKLGEALIGDFSSLFNVKADAKKAAWKAGESPFKPGKIDGKDLVLKTEYQKQEEEAGTWNTEDNPDDDGYVNSEKSNQVVIDNDSGEEAGSKDLNLKLAYAPIVSKGYEGFIIMVATYTDESGKTYEKQDVFKEKDKEKWLQKLKDEWKIPDGTQVEEGQLDEEQTTASTKMSVTLQKITGSTSYDITLTKINANYDLAQVADDLDAILSDDAFVASVPEEETTYVVVPDEDGALDVTELTDGISSVSEIYQQLMNQTGDMLDYLKIARWGAKGAIRNDFMSTLESMRWSFEGILDKLGEWIITDTGKAPQIIHTNEIVDIDDLTAVELVNAVREKVESYMDNLDLVYVDFSTEQQSYIDTFKESINSMCEYSLGRLILQ